MQKRRLGNTGMEVSVLGLGTVKFGRNQGVNYPNAFSLPTDAEIKGLLAQAKDLGINILDTAPAYGESEERLGKLLKDERHNWLISSKVGEEFTEGKSHFDFSPPAVRRSIERSLSRLKTDYLDLVLAHSNGADMCIIEEDDIFTTLAQLKQEGKIRAFGMSTKTIPGGLATIKQADVAMVTFNPMAEEEREVIDFAHVLEKGILIKKALLSGHLQKLDCDHPLQAALQFIFKEPGVSSVIIGTINPEHLRQNATVVMQVCHQYV